MAHRYMNRIIKAFSLCLLLYPFGGDLLAQSAPTATTGAATGVGSTTATLNGTVNANGASTTTYFEYGLDTSYGNTWTADQSPVTGSTNTAVTATPGELLPDTTYHYRVVAQNAYGTTQGADMTFTTLPNPPLVLTAPATGVGADSATLNGMVNPQGHNTTVTFEYGTDTSYGTTVTADQSPLTSFLDMVWPVTATITGLANNTTYHYRVVAVNAGGTTYGNDMTFTTGSSGTVPTATTNAATGVGAIAATLNGTVNAGNALTVVTFEYGLGTSYGTTVLAAQNPLSGDSDTPVSATLSDLLPNTTYHYRVAATNIQGSATGADMTFTTLPLAPSATTNGASAVTPSSATLNGTVNAQGSSTTVTFEYGLTTAYGTTVTAAESPVTGGTDTAVSRAITGLANGVTYHYRVVATNAGGTTYGEDRSFTAGAVAPSAFTGAATTISPTGATLNGTVNANNFTATVTFEYGLTTDYDRSVQATPGIATGASNTAVFATLSSLVPNTTYHYRVVAQNAGGTAFGADMTFTTPAPPAVVTGAASSVTTTGATLNGTVNANNSSTIVTFEYGTTSAYGTTVTADQSPVTDSTSAAVSRGIAGLTPDMTYHFRVVGQNAHGTTYGADMTFVTSAPAAPTATTDPAAFILSDGATLNGTVTANNALTTVTFEYGLNTSYGSTVNAVPGSFEGTTATPVIAVITGLSNNTTYHYRVVATNAYGTTNGADMTFTTSGVPSAVTEPATGLGTDTATLNGTVNPNTETGSVAVFFQYGLTTVYTQTVGAQPNSLTGTTNTAVSGVISGLASNTTYHYRVVAMNIPYVTYGADMTFTTPAAEPAPTAVTNAASGVSAYTATVNGTVNANNTTATVIFEYGLDTAYGRTATADQSPVTGAVDTAVSSSLLLLDPNTTYHYRVVAQNADNATFGADMTFTTDGIPPEANTDAATAVTATGAILNGTVNANNDSTAVTFEYGLTLSYGATVTADQSPVTGGSNTAVSTVLTGLTGNTTYHFRVRAQNGSGTTYGADMTFFTGTAVPTVSTGAASGIGPTGATLNGTVNANNASTTVTFELGQTIAYGRTVTADQSPVTGGTDTAVSAYAGGLSPNTTYHFRVVGQNAAGTATGADRIFTTNPASTPAVTTANVTNISFASATGGGNVLDEGDAPVTARGVCWSTNPDPTLADNFTSDGTGPGAFTSLLAGLTPSTTYRVRAYATNIYGTVYGGEVQFSTNPDPTPAITTEAVTNISFASATGGGNVLDEGDAPVTARGVCWSTNPGPTLADSFTSDGTGLGAFTSLLTGLNPSTTYYVRAYATNIYGTSYGGEVQFTTNAVNTPVLNTTDVTHITSNSARTGGTITQDGGAPITARGVCWSTDPGPTLSDTCTDEGAGTGTFVSLITGLDPEMAYYVRAYATNFSGTGYGNEVAFATNGLPVEVPAMNHPGILLLGVSMLTGAIMMMRRKNRC